jgi:hypothetical protein
LRFFSRRFAPVAVATNNLVPPFRAIADSAWRVKLSEDSAEVASSFNAVSHQFGPRALSPARRR